MSDNDFEPENNLVTSPNPLRGPITSSGTSSSNSAASPSSPPPSTTKRRKTGGKKKGWRKPTSEMKNGRFTEQDIYTFVPEESIPQEHRIRFINLCDLMIVALGADTMSETDLEEIALYYRERIYCDSLYKTFADAGGTTDTTLIHHIEKLNKSLEQRKSNLGARFVDKGKKRKDSNTSTLMELLSDFDTNKNKFEFMSEDKAQTIEENKKKFTNTAEYMTAHAGSKKQETGNE